MAEQLVITDRPAAERGPAEGAPPRVAPAAGAASGAVLDRLDQIDRGRRRRLALVIGALAVVAAALALASIAFGAHVVAPARLWAILTGAGGVDRDTLVVGTIRLPRTLAAAAVGASLAVSGVLIQGLFRNPLADPGILGISSGAALAAATIIVIGDRLFGGTAFEVLPIGAFLGAMTATLLLSAAGRRAGRTDTGVVLIAGLAFSALAGAALGLIVTIADDRQLRDITFWSLGSFGGVSWAKAMVALPFLAAPLAAAPFLARGFDALAFGEAEAQHMGLRVEWLKGAAIAAAALGVGAAVALVGVIGFVGMIVPHAVRLAIGPAHGPLLVASALAGAALTLAADLVARTAVAPAELPIGILTALVGAPVFLHLVLGRRGGPIGG